jgi:hypothetical protein
MKQAEKYDRAGRIERKVFEVIAYPSSLLFLRAFSITPESLQKRNMIFANSANEFCCGRVTFLREWRMCKYGSWR